MCILGKGDAAYEDPQMATKTQPQKWEARDKMARRDRRRSGEGIHEWNGRYELKAIHSFGRETQPREVHDWEKRCSLGKYTHGGGNTTPGFRKER